MVCEVCGVRPADRQVEVEKDSGRRFLLNVDAVCALWLVGPVGVDVLSPRQSVV